MNDPSIKILVAIALAGAVLAGCNGNDSRAPVNTAEAPPQWSAVALGQIDIEGGLLKLSMPREGLVAQVFVEAGAHVNKDQLLASLDPKPAALAVAGSEAALEQSSAKIAALKIRSGDLELRWKRLAAVAAAGAGGQQSADDAHAAVNESHGDLAAAKADAAAARQKLAASRRELEQQSLHAPVDGEVVRRSIQPGTMVNAQSASAFILMPDAPRIVRAELNSAFVGSVQVGMSADIVEDGSGRSYSAKVMRLGKVFGASELEEDPQLRANARNIECVLAIDPSAPTDLLIGQRVQVRFSARGQSGG